MSFGDLQVCDTLRRMSACHCDRGWVCEEHSRQPWPHDRCHGPGRECMNVRCQYGKEALVWKPLDDAHDREHYPLPSNLQPR